MALFLGMTLGFALKRKVADRMRREAEKPGFPVLLLSGECAECGGFLLILL